LIRSHSVGFPPGSTDFKVSIRELKIPGDHI
jgi:hypothetical protein